MANIIEIHDFSDPALDVYARLTENQLLNRADPDTALFVAERPLVLLGRCSIRSAMCAKFSPAAVKIFRFTPLMNPC